MKTKAAFVLGAGVGYVLGTRAGRQQFEKIKGWASDTWHDPRVQSRVDDLESTATQFAKEQGSALADKAKEQGFALKDKAVDAVKSATSRTGHGSDDDPWSTDDAVTRTSPPDGTTESDELRPPVDRG